MEGSRRGLSANEGRGTMNEPLDESRAKSWCTLDARLAFKQIDMYARGKREDERGSVVVAVVVVET
jgi:hypothetical protein